MDGEYGTKFATIPLINNALLDGTRTFTLQLTNTSPGVWLVAPSNAIITILDDDAPATVQWDSSGYEVNENGGTVILTLVRSGGPTNVSVSYSSLAGTALAGLDYVTTNGDINFEPNETSKAVPVTILDDYPIEGDEFFSVKLSNPVSASLGDNSKATVTIHDADYSPEDLYGHRLYIYYNYNFYFVSNNSFSNTLAIYNPDSGTSRPGYVGLSETKSGIFTGATNKFLFPAIAGGNYYYIDVGGNWSVQAGDNKLYNIYATIFEVSGSNNLTYQSQDYEWIFQFIGTSPPGAGAVDPNSGVVAPGFNPPPILTNVVVSGPALIQENSNAIYRATAFLNNGTTATNMSPTWTSTAFSISQAGVLTAGNVQADLPVTIAGAITYGNTITKTAAATIVNVQAARLQGLGLTNKQFKLQLTGTTGRRYAIESSTNLGSTGNWIAFTTNQIFSNSVFQLTDPGSTNSKTRFYRARQTP